MRIYEFKVNYSQSLLLTDVYSEESSGHPMVTKFKGESKCDEWWPIKLDTLEQNTYSDFPHYIIGKPILSEKVKCILELYIKDEVELLSLIHAEQSIYMVNVINILDCVDWKRSDVSWFEEEYFLGFNKLVFNFTKIPSNTYIFKIKETAETCVYITESFKELVENNHLQGLDFSVVYDSEFTEEKELEQQQNYEAALLGIENTKGPEFSYEEAEKKVDQNKAVASGKWRMQMDDEGKFWLGNLTLELKYQWVRPVYIPPILLEYQWHEVEKSAI